jgi:Pyruvate kinase, barrel domain
MAMFECSRDALAEQRPDDWREMTLIVKIETARAVTNLPGIIVQAAGRQPTAIMIARGDLSVEIGFARTAEMQEEILWLGEAVGSIVLPMARFCQVRFPKLLRHLGPLGRLSARAYSSGISFPHAVQPSEGERANSSR